MFRFHFESRYALSLSMTLFAMTLQISTVGQVVINELSAFKGLSDEFGEDCDWIELLNTGDQTVDLTGFHLSDNTDNWNKWELPNAVLAPGERMLFLASDQDKSYLADDWQSLVVDEDEWRYWPALCEPDATWKDLGFDDTVWNLGMGGFGYGDDDDNTLITLSNVFYLRKSFTIDSLEELGYLLFHADYDDGYIAYLNGQEISRSATMNGLEGTYNQFSNGLHEALLYQGLVPEHLLLDLSELENLLIEGENVLAVQVHNDNANSSDCTARFFLSASPKEGMLDLDPAPAWIPELPTYYHTNFKLSAGEPLILSDADGNLIDFIDIDPSLSFGLTMGRTEDGLNNICIFETPSPGDSNTDSWCYDGIETGPAISLESGWYTGPQTATLSPTGPNQTIRYSTNGDLPGSSHPIYSSPIQLNESSVLSARVFGSGNKLPSKSVDITCIINEDNHDLPVFSVITDSLNLWDYNEGIYVSGPNAQENFPYFGSNFWQPWSKWSRLEYFDAEQQLQAKAEFDLEIHGGWSRAQAQRSFRFDFKSIYTGSLEYPVFSQKPFIEEAGNLNIRNGGQHGPYDKIQDAIVQRTVRNTNVHSSSYEPCLLYLNGDYWGVYGIREKVDEQYVEDNFDFDEDEVDLLNSWGALAGTDSDFNADYELLMGMNPQDDDYYEALAGEFDLANYYDYFIIQTYVQNLDWLGIAWGVNNVKLWRSQQGGKWSYVLYDTDAGFGFFGSNPSDNYIQYAANPLESNAHSNLFGHNLLNPQFKCEFANRYADLVNTIFQPENFNAEVDYVEALIENAMPDHIERWQEPVSMPAWLAAVENIRSYNELRVPHARSHVNIMLGFTGQVTVTLDVEPAGAGSIQISTISPDEYPWNGVYFNGCPVHITAIPNEGYEFNFWQENEFIDEIGQLSDSVLVNIQSNSSFIAHFDACNPDAALSITSEGNDLSFTSTGIETIDEVAWFLNGTAVGNGSNFEANQSGTYLVQITNGTCVYTSEEFFFIYNLVSESEEDALSFSPNPASSEFRIVSPAIDLASAILEVWSTSGQLMHREAMPNSTISVSNWPAGVYQVVLSNGKQSSSARLVVD